VCARHPQPYRAAPCRQCSPVRAPACALTSAVSPYTPNHPMVLAIIAPPTDAQSILQCVPLFRYGSTGLVRTGVRGAIVWCPRPTGGRTVTSDVPCKLRRVGREHMYHIGRFGPDHEWK
jgi:hypothetical protein